MTSSEIYKKISFEKNKNYKKIIMFTKNNLITAQTY
jgi:hypothetical protein